MGRSKGIGLVDSAILDGFRATAALMVALYHWSLPNFCDVHLNALHQIGHTGVIVFFVLSGYVIGAMTDTKESTAEFYTIARMSRLYSVVAPCLILIPIFDFLTANVFGNPVTALPSAQSGATQVIVSLAFANEWWSLAIRPFSDSAYWSLSYEAAYYLMWGLFIFGGRYKWLLLAAASAVVGPRILLLMPVWLMCAALYRYGRKLPLSWSMLGLAVGLVTLALSRQRLTIDTLGRSADFITDNLRGFGFTLLLWAALSLSQDIGSLPRKLTLLVKWTAGRSFTVYLLHSPLLYLFAAALPRNQLGRWWALAVLVMALIVSLAAGNFIEPTKRRWRTALQVAFRASRRVSPR